MEQHFLPFEEDLPDDNNDYEQMTDNRSWRVFNKVVEWVEAKVNVLDFDSDDGVEMFNAYKDFLNYKFGEQYAGRTSKLLGIADIADTNGDRTGEDRTVRPNEVIRFQGISIDVVDEAWQVQLEFAQSECKDGLNNCYYYVAPRNIMQLEMASEPDQDEEEIEDTQLTLSTRLASARNFTSSAEFLNAPTDAQQKWLDDISLNMDADITSFYDEYDTEIICSKYYTVFDDMNDMGISMQDCFTDQSALDPVHQFVIKGKVERFIYAELISEPDKHFQHTNDFTIGHGVPCLTVYNDEQKCRYYVLPDSIEALTIAE